MKKILSLIIATAMLMGCITITNAEPNEQETQGVTLSVDEYGVVVTSDIERDAAVIKTSYGANGEMSATEISGTTKLHAGSNTINFKSEINGGDKIMVWDGLDTMEPLCGAQVYSKSEVPLENKLFDGDIETTNSFVDGKWKPGVGEWRMGLGTSVTVDTENVSDNSTKSAKITNAALYQALTLEGGESYKLSFDIYLGSGLDKSKLSWGLFKVRDDNGYIGDIVCGYKEGIAYSESIFDESKRNEWQHVEVEFACSSTAVYAVQFFYGGADSIYVDNISLTGGKPSPFIIEQHDVSYTDKLGKEINIYGRLYRPNTDEKCGLIILSHGYNAYGDAFAEKCEYFARNGYAAYAFDFCGGSTVSKSTGRVSTEMTLFTETEDLIAVFDYLSKLDCIDANRMFLSGDSQGGMVSALAAEELGNDGVKGMALQFPAFGIPDVWRNEEPNLPRDHWGLTLGKVFATSVKDFYTFNYVGKNYTNDLLIISGTADPVVPISSVRQAVNSVYKNAELVEFEGEGHGFSKAKEWEARALMLEFMENL